MTALLTDKNIVIYGAGGGIGRGMARTFAREGANLHLAGRTRASVQKVAVVNLVSRGDVQGTAYVDMTTAGFLAPITAGLAASFVIARAAAREMVRRGSGVILAITSGSSRGTMPMMGGTGPAEAATETFLRYLAAEVGPHGVRVLGLWTAGVRETFDLEDDTNEARIQSGMSGEDIDRVIGPMTMLRHTPRLDEVVDAAAFLVSDRAAGMTGTIANVTCGLVPGP